MLTTGDCYEVVVKQSYLSQTLLNVWHFKLLVNLGGAQAAFLALANDLKEVARVEQINSLTYVDWVARQVSGDGIAYDVTTCRPVGGDIWQGVFTGTLTGADAGGGDPHAPNTVLEVALRTGLRGRTRQGRKFFSGYSEGKTTLGVWTPAVVTATTTAMTTLMTKYGPSGTDPTFNLSVFSEFLTSGCKMVPSIVNGRVVRTLTHVQAGDEAEGNKPVKSFAVSNVVRTMHRRQIGVGI